MTMGIETVPILGIPLAGTSRGDKAFDEFVHDLLSIGGALDTRLLWLPKKSQASTETTTSTDRSRNARVITYDATVAARYNPLGSGVSLTFDGTDDEADTPDTANLSFGDSAADEPFSIFAWVNQTATATIKTILSKYDITTGSTKREWWFYLDAAEKMVLELYDESAAARIGRAYNTVLATGSLLFLAATYDGSRANTGIRVYSAAARVDDTDSSTGTYVAMENTASLVRLGFSQGASAGANFFNGSMACVGLVAKQLSIDELWAMKAAGNAFYDISL